MYMQQVMPLVLLPFSYMYLSEAKKRDAYILIMYSILSLVPGLSLLPHNKYTYDL
jgi:hypothetical protein